VLAFASPVVRGTEEVLVDTRRLFLFLLLPAEPALFFRERVSGIRHAAKREERSGYFRWARRPKPDRSNYTIALFSRR